MAGCNWCGSKNIKTNRKGDPYCGRCGREQPKDESKKEAS